MTILRTITACFAVMGAMLPDIGHSAGAPAASAAADGFTLTSVGVTLPDGGEAFPPGPGKDAAEQNCTMCHSAGMVLTQPVLTKPSWEAEVNKMRLVYKAPIAAEDVPAIVAYLSSIKGPQ